MSTEAVSPLRRRMIEDMTIRQFGEHTKRDYVRQVRQLDTSNYLDTQETDSA